jgi:hypothetical protein
MLRTHLPALTPEQCHSITIGVGFEIGLLVAAEENGRAVIHEMSRGSKEYYAELRRRGLLLPWSTNQWLMHELLLRKIHSHGEVSSPA